MPGKWGLIGLPVVLLVSLALGKTFGLEVQILLGIPFAVLTAVVARKWDLEDQNNKQDPQ